MMMGFRLFACGLSVLFSSATFLTLLLVIHTLSNGFGRVSGSTHVRSDAQMEGPPWLSHGRDLTNNRWARFEEQISTASVEQLREKWSFTTESDVTATPSVADGVVYFPDWSGALFAIEQSTGAQVWQKNLTAMVAEYIGSSNTSIPAQFLSRSTPTIAGDRLLVGIYGPSAVIALSRDSGAFLWGKVLDPHPNAIVTMSGTAYERYFYVGSSSAELIGATNVCCSFQGAFFKLDIETGEIMWRVPMLPSNKGRTDQYAGSALWGSSPPIDVTRREVYIATGDNYRVPEEILQCELNYRNLSNPTIPDPCLEPGNHAESVLAINIDTGDITWARHLGGYDTFIVPCVPLTGHVNCTPGIPGPDFDFGEAPMLLTVPSNTSPGRDVVVVGQKSGIVWALDRGTGEIVWHTQAGPGGNIGGAAWGMTTDGLRVFTNIINNLQKNFTLAPGTNVINSSAWVALNASTGEVLWSTANPSGGWNNAPLTHADGVVFGGAASSPTGVVAMDVDNGEVLKFLPTNGSTYGGPSISNGCLYQPLGITFTGAYLAPLINVSLPHGNSVVSFCEPSAFKFNRL